ncbi:hypothetical protein HRI_000848300 [Hibiscus trionum]|uniref:Endonuclease/exonuclease/phosphatase domain-containing protein n=1 Tax=Hibiscus trionum TaxID=183268 RepID=A0A9W7H6C7_HIBTR|nr:hypothetical protein HRI_000848300 [Hibiscus trionum]
MTCYFLSWNVRGLGKMEKVRGVSRTIKSSKARVTFLQEPKLSVVKPRMIERLRNRMFGEAAVIPSEGASCGLISMWDTNFFALEKKTELRKCLVLVGSLTQWKIKVGLINVYAPNIQSERKEFFDRLAESIESLGLPILIGGDFNTVKVEGEKVEWSPIRAR